MRCCLLNNIVEWWRHIHGSGNATSRTSYVFAHLQSVDCWVLQSANDVSLLWETSNRVVDMGGWCKGSSASTSMMRECAVRGWVVVFGLCAVCGSEVGGKFFHRVGIGRKQNLEITLIFLPCVLNEWAGARTNTSSPSKQHMVHGYLHITIII